MFLINFQSFQSFCVNTWKCKLVCKHICQTHPGFAKTVSEVYIFLIMTISIAKKVLVTLRSLFMMNNDDDDDVFGLKLSFFKFLGQFLLDIFSQKFLTTLM